MQIFHGIPDVRGRERARDAGKRTLVVGAPALTRVVGRGSAGALPARGRLGADLRQLRDEGGLDFLALPETGVCGIGLAAADDSATSASDCCGCCPTPGPAPRVKAGCCG